MKVDSNRRPEIVRQLADYEKISGVLWIVLGVIQILAIVTAIAGVWNIIAGLSRLAMAKRVANMDPEVPKDYEGVISLVLIGLVNLVLGAFFGLLFVAFDFYVRERVLSQRWVFEGHMGETSPSYFSQDVLQSLEMLGRLRANGVLNETEFTSEKARLLAGTS